MDAREQRGLEIAARFKLVRRERDWSVPSQTGEGRYTVSGLDADTPTCTCPDYETRRLVCKHIYAVRYVIQREFEFDGEKVTEKVTETVSVTKTTKRTYPQNWPAYNAAQTNEKDRFMVLLRDLCAGLAEPEQKRGRPRLSVRDSVFTAVMKVYTTASARRCMSDLREAHERGHISKLPCHNSVLNALENPDLASILRSLIGESARPLKAVETDFAVDSSGFTTCRFESWFDHKYGVTRRQHTWVKAHVMCGVKTNVVTAIEIHDKDAADNKQLPALVESTARTFAVAEVSADKVYGTVRNADTIANNGATPFIAFKGNATGTAGHGTNRAGTGAWGKMFGYFMYRRDEFLAHYHKRSNVESTFSMMKRKFGDSLRSKTDTAQVNETLAKVLCHNLVVLIHETYELGLDPVFWAESSPAQEVAR
ncbi:MAG TPA: transposase [Methylomirabilota bacterium]|jgi:transposase|nr:transposase [Methylomirabilota bacterium]